MMDLPHVAFFLVVGHAVCDYPLQGDFMARAKNHRTPVPGFDWLAVLVFHAVIHAGAVLLVTGSLDLALAELCFHAAIDFGKCSGRFGFRVDQGLHLLCKALYVAVLAISAAYSP